MQLSDPQVFNYNSRDHSMVLTLEPATLPELSVKEEEKKMDVDAKALIGRPVMADWPHLIEVKVVELLSYNWKYTLIEDEADREEGDEEGRRSRHHHQHHFRKTAADANVSSVGYQDGFFYAELCNNYLSNIFFFKFYQFNLRLISVCIRIALKHTYNIFCKLISKFIS